MLEHSSARPPVRPFGGFKGHPFASIVTTRSLRLLEDLDGCKPDRGCTRRTSRNVPYAEGESLGRRARTFPWTSVPTCSAVRIVRHPSVVTPPTMRISTAANLIVDAHGELLGTSRMQRASRSAMMQDLSDAPSARAFQRTPPVGRRRDQGSPLCFASSHHPSKSPEGLEGPPFASQTSHHPSDRTEGPRVPPLLKTSGVRCRTTVNTWAPFESWRTVNELLTVADDCWRPNPPSRRRRLAVTFLA